MTDKEVKKLSRKNLLEILIHQGREIESLRAKLLETERLLKKREIAIDKAGSIAEAALVLNGVFQSAQDACQQYADNIAQRQKALCQQMEQESREKARQILAQAEKRQSAMLRDAQVRCDEAPAKGEADSRKQESVQ